MGGHCNCGSSVLFVLPCECQVDERARSLYGMIRNKKPENQEILMRLSCLLICLNWMPTDNQQFEKHENRGTVEERERVKPC